MLHVGVKVAVAEQQRQVGLNAGQQAVAMIPRTCWPYSTVLPRCSCFPPEHSLPSEGDRQEALRRCDRLSLRRLQLVTTGDSAKGGSARGGAVTGLQLDNNPAHQGRRGQPKPRLREGAAAQLAGWAWTVIVRLPSLSRCRA
jgi:hypothetical protein